MCNKVPGTKAMAHVVDIAAAAAAAVAAATTLDKLMAAQLLQQQQQHASTAGQQQATAAGGIAAAAGVAAAVLPSSSRLRGSVSGACKVLLAPAFLELVFGTGYGCNTAAAAAAARNGHSQAQSEAQQPAQLVLEAAKLAVQDLRGCVMTACQYVISQGAAGMQQQLLLQLLGLQHSSSVAEGVLGLCKAVGVVTASGSGTELKLRWCG
jgi:hypothetical protein